MNENQFATTARLQSSHFPIHHHSARLHYQINPIHVINVVVVVLLTWLTGLLMIWAWFGHKPPANNQPAEKSYQPSQPAIASSFNEKHTTRSSARPDQYTAWFIGQMCCNATPTHCVCIFKLLIKMLLIFFAISVCNCLLCPACLPASQPSPAACFKFFVIWSVYPAVATWFHTQTGLVYISSNYWNPLLISKCHSVWILPPVASIQLPTDRNAALTLPLLSG